MSTMYQQRMGLVEDIMTPRSLLKTVSQRDVAHAAGIAGRYKFDAIPVSDDDRIVGFWSSLDRKIHQLTSEHLVAHDQPVGTVLERLLRHGVQFVSYRDQIVGLIDLSDLNKPLARVIMAQPLLAVEQLIVTKFRVRPVSERQLVAILGAEKIAEAAARKTSTRRENLDAPLVEFLHFGDILRVASAVGLISIARRDIKRLNLIRNRVLHPAHRLVAERREGNTLIWAMSECETMLDAVSDIIEGAPR